jgi:hypothetical protein
MNALSVIASRRDDLCARVELVQQYLQLQRELGDRRTEAVARGNLGQSWLDRGETMCAKREIEGARSCTYCFLRRTARPITPRPAIINA